VDAFVWLSEGVTNMYEGIVVPNFMRYLRGTPWLPVAFNLLGCEASAAASTWTPPTSPNSTACTSATTAN
jgi:hypothetical protein